MNGKGGRISYHPYDMYHMRCAMTYNALAAWWGIESEARRGSSGRYHRCNTDVSQVYHRYHTHLEVGVLGILGITNTLPFGM